ncbi:MAG: transporter [Clostridiales bacterium]|jgi:predicted permease|nr:transporter [Clostridiales bacterium]
MVLFIYILVGVYAKKISIITKENQQKYIDFVLGILMPCMIFNSYRQVITMDVIKKASIIIGIAFSICIAAMVLGKLLYRKYPFEKRSIMQYGTLINNAGFAGLPISYEIFGEKGLFYASFFLIPNRIFMWSAGISLFTKTDTKTKWKSVLLNPNIIAVELGLLRSILQIELPDFINNSIQNIGNSVSPISMIVIGAILADVDIKTIFDKSVFYVAGVRLLLLPLLTIGIISFFDLSPTISGVALVLTAMPVGTSTALLAAKYNADVDFASKCVFVTTILSLITVPLLMLII